MKNKLFLCTVFLVAASWASAQTNDFPPSGNVGIDTMSPSHKLQVTGSGRFNVNALSYNEINANASGAYLWQYNAAGNLSWVIRGYAEAIRRSSLRRNKCQC